MGRSGVRLHAGLILPLLAVFVNADYYGPLPPHIQQQAPVLRPNEKRQVMARPSEVVGLPRQQRRMQDGTIINPFEWNNSRAFVNEAADEWQWELRSDTGPIARATFESWQRKPQMLD
eukprot:2211313-Prymnesium_polylepis.1